MGVGLSLPFIAINEVKSDKYIANFYTIMN